MEAKTSQVLLSHSKGHRIYENFTGLETCTKALEAMAVSRQKLEMVDVEKLATLAQEMHKAIDQIVIEIIESQSLPIGLE